MSLKEHFLAIQTYSLGSLLMHHEHLYCNIHFFTLLMQCCSTPIFIGGFCSAYWTVPMALSPSALPLAPPSLPHQMNQMNYLLLSGCLMACCHPP